MSPPIEKLSVAQAETNRDFCILLILVGIYWNMLANGVWRSGCLEGRVDSSQAEISGI